MEKSGYSFVEILAVFSILLSGSLLAIPLADGLLAGSRIRSAGHEAMIAFHLARIDAVRTGRNTAVRFVAEAGGFRMTLYRDGNGNGVRNAEIVKGTDRPLRSVFWDRGDVTIGILQNVRVPDPSDPSRALTKTSDPVRFNNSDLCSFSPLGECTPGSLYLTDRKRRMAVVRVDNRSGRIRVLYFTAGDRRWAP
ncbi:MAG: pilus assembly FimT family protein [Thermoanaerobaculia bacterium]